MRPARKFQGTMQAQHGTTLIMTLVFLLLLSLLGITAMSTSTLEEKMTGNTKDLNLSFQAAETALRAAEVWVESTTVATDLNVNNANGIYDPSTTGTEVWDTVTWTGSSNLVVYPGTPGTTASGSLGDVNTRPKYIIEKLTTESLPGSGTRITVRITARGTGASDNTVSMVQSTYAKTYP
jgi:type IV pilus assembly protein PilX